MEKKYRVVENSTLEGLESEVNAILNFEYIAEEQRNAAGWKAPGKWELAGNLFLHPTRGAYTQGLILQTK